jgi:hypothetical protein
MEDTAFFEIVGDDYAYAPGGEGLPPTIISSELYPQLIMLLIGLFAGNYMLLTHSSRPGS